MCDGCPPLSLVHLKRLSSLKALEIIDSSDAFCSRSRCQTMTCRCRNMSVSGNPSSAFQLPEEETARRRNRIRKAYMHQEMLQVMLSHAPHILTAVALRKREEPT